MIALPAAEKNHARQYARCKCGKVYQDMLIDPIDLSHDSPNAVPNDCAGCSTRCESDLDRNAAPDLVLRCDAVQEPDASGGDGSDVTSVSVEEGTKQAPTFEPVFTGKREPALVRC